MSADVTVPAAAEDTTPITGYPDGSWINFASWSPDGRHITFTTRSPGQVRSGQVTGQWPALDARRHWTPRDASQ